MLTSAKEKTIREALGAKIAALTGTAFVRRPMISSRQDWAELLGIVNASGELELRLTTVDLAGFTDSETEGCDDDPVVFLTYRVHLFHEYVEARPDSSNSTDDFAAVVIGLRNAFLQGSRDIPGVPRAEHLPLVQSGFIILGDDPVTGAYGHSVDLEARVEVR